MEASGLKSFLGFRPKGSVCWIEEDVSPPSPKEEEGVEASQTWRHSPVEAGEVEGVADL